MAVLLRPHYRLQKCNSPAKKGPVVPPPRQRQAQELVDRCAQFMETIWPSRVFRLPFREFISEVVRRSRVHSSVFQVAICYIARMKPIILEARRNGQVVPQRIACGRRVFIAALQLATKYLQDRCYSVHVWSRISGLSPKDLVANELALMQALDWNLFVSHTLYLRSCKWALGAGDDTVHDVDNTQNVNVHSIMGTEPGSPPALTSDSDSVSETASRRNSEDPFDEEI